MKVEKQVKKKIQGFGTGAGFKPGKSGNPLGRPVTERCIPEILRRIGNDPAPPSVRRFLSKQFPTRDLTNLDNREATLLRAYYDADRGKDSARDFIANRTEGKVRDRINLTTGDEKVNKPVIDFSALTPDKLYSLRETLRAIVRNRA